jgi:hypothetical protein
VERVPDGVPSHPTRAIIRMPSWPFNGLADRSPHDNRRVTGCVIVTSIRASATAEVRAMAVRTRDGDGWTGTGAPRTFSG